MAYEYESDIPEFLKGIESEHPLDLSKEIKEVQEVYRKAKAWNNYLLSVEEDAKKEFGDNEALIKHAVELNKKIFMEDE